MIKSFRSRSLSAFWHKGDATGIRADLVKRVKLRLAALNAARRPDGMNVPSWNLHKLRGKPTRYAVSVSGPWRITFEWEGENAVRVDLEQYH